MPRYLKVDLEDTDIEDLELARDVLNRAIAKKRAEIKRREKERISSDFRGTRRETKSARSPTSRRTSPRSRKVAYNDTVLIRNIPESLLNADKIIRVMEEFGDVLRIQILRDRNDEIINRAYVVFDDPKVAQELIRGKQPFKRVRDARKNIIIEKAAHIPSNQELEEEEYEGDEEYEED